MGRKKGYVVFKKEIIICVCIKHKLYGDKLNALPFCTAKGCLTSLVCLCRLIQLSESERELLHSPS